MVTRRQSRRDFIALAGTVGVVSLAGCSSDTQTDDSQPVIDQDARPVTDETSPSELDAFDTTPPSVWSMAQATAAHTGYASVAGPTAKDVRWERELPRAVLSGAAVANETVFVTTSKKRVYALSTQSGTVRWERKLDGDLPYTPACAGGLVLVSVHETGLVALSAASGDTVWTATHGGGPVTAPTVYDGTVTFAAADDVVYVVAAEDGSKRADSVPFPLGGLQTLTVEDDRIYVGAVSGVYAMDGRCVRVWSRSLQDAVRGPPVLVGNRLFVAENGGSVLALDKRTGNVAWTVELETGINAPISANEESLFVAAGKDAYCLGQDTGEERWVSRLGAVSTTGLALGTNALYLGTFAKTVHALGAADGEEQWHYKTELPVHSPAALVEGQLYIGDNAGVVRAFG